MQDLGVARVGRLAAEDELSPVGAPDLLVHAGVVEEPVARAARLGRHVRRPEPGSRAPAPAAPRSAPGAASSSRSSSALVREHVLLHERAVERPALDDTPAGRVTCSHAVGSFTCASLCNSGTTTRSAASPSRRRPTGSGSIRSGRPKPTGRTPSRRWHGSRRPPSASRSGARSCRCRRARRPRRRRPSRRSTSSRAAASCSGSAPRARRSPRAGTARPGASRSTRTREYVEIVRTILRREEPLEHHGEHYDIPYSGAGRDGPRQAAEDHHPPRAQRGADLPGGDRAEERRAHGRDRGRLAADLLLARAGARRARPRARGGLRAAAADAPTAGISRRSCRS